MVKISLEGSSLFNKILIELAQTYKLWLDDRPSFFNGMSQEESIIRVINPSFQISKSLRNKYRIRQLYHSAESLSIVKKLAIIIRKCCNLKCLAYELHKVINEILYEYVNTVFIDFLDSVDHNGTFFNIRSDILEKVINEKVTFFKNSFSKYSYKFPVTVFNLNEEVRLSKNIFLKPIDSEELNRDELSLFNKDRMFNCNYYIVIHVQEKCSKELSLQLAEKTKNTTFNVLKLLATHLSPNAVPLFTSNDKVNCAYDFYCYGKNNESMDSVTKFRFPYFQFDSKAFLDIITNKGEEPNLIDIAFQFVELLLTPHFKNERVVDRLERSLMWYGDSVTDQINYQQIQKLVSSLEALVNFRDDNVTEVFKRRVANLNITYYGVDFDIENKAKQLYDARSKIVHGSSLDVKLDFCLIKFCSETILLAIYYFSIFGFGKTNFNITLPTFLDDIPKNAILE